MLIFRELSVKGLFLNGSVNLCRDTHSAYAWRAEIVKESFCEETLGFFFIANLSPGEEEGGVSHSKNGHNRNPHPRSANVEGEAFPVAYHAV